MASGIRPMRERSDRYGRLRLPSEERLLDDGSAVGRGDPERQRREPRRENRLVVLCKYVVFGALVLGTFEEGSMPDFGSFLGGVVGAGGNLLGDYLGQQMSQSSIEQQEQFQAGMANTAFQRAKADMLAAGINPIMAYGHPASAPSGGAATMQAPQIGSDLMAGVNSLADALNKAKQGKMLDSQTTGQDIENVIKRKDSNIKDTEVAKAAAERGYLSTGKGAADFELGLSSRFKGVTGMEGLITSVIERLIPTSGKDVDRRGGGPGTLGGSGDAHNLGGALESAPNLGGP